MQYIYTAVAAVEAHSPHSSDDNMFQHIIIAVLPPIRCTSFPDTPLSLHLQGDFWHTIEHDVRICDRSFVEDGTKFSWRHSMQLELYDRPSAI